MPLLPENKANGKTNGVESLVQETGRAMPPDNRIVE
jgi:hypothetical protein